MRVIWIILDSVGMGELPDAEAFGDKGADTLGHLFLRYPDMKIPNMRKLGLGNIDGINNTYPVEKPEGMYGRAKELSNGKDTVTGHWEMAGIYTEEAFRVYPDGFPEDIINEFIEKTGCGGVLGNKVASGTEIIKELGDEHYKTGYPIIYTSADSVFQIAASKEVTGLEKLYEMCKTAREILTGDRSVARVIARPFTKKNEEYVRTPERRDFSVEPDSENLLVYLKEAGIEVCAIGKISDVFAGKGVTRDIHTKDNMDGVDKTLECMKEIEHGLIFTNLVEFDSTWGHRRNPEGYAKGLEDFDARLPEIISAMQDDDILIINADHGCDPTFKGTDHTREYIPILVYGKTPSLQSIESCRNIGTRESFADIGASIAKLFGVKSLKIGESFL